MWQARAFLFASSQWYWCALPRRNSHRAFIKLTNVQCTETWVSPLLRAGPGPHDCHCPASAGQWSWMYLDITVKWCYCIGSGSSASKAHSAACLLPWPLGLPIFYTLFLNEDGRIVLISCIIDFDNTQVWFRLFRNNLDAVKVVKAFLIFSGQFWRRPLWLCRHWDSS